MSTSPSENTFAVIKKPDLSKHPVFGKDFYNNNEIKQEYQIDDETADRYLTEDEINTITEILRTVKKSDLEAIIEIYNLAQEIYDEIDGANEKSDKNTVNILQINDNEMKKTKNKDSISHWYEPLQYSKKRVKDLNIEATNIIPTPRTYPHPLSYFNRPFPDHELMKSPYYYPMSNFQRMSSYMHTPYNTLTPEPPRPCKKQNYPPWYPPKLPTPQRSMQLLPYPFSYIHHHNLSHPASFYYNSFPWAQLDIHNRNKNYPQAYSTYLRDALPVVEQEEIGEVKEIKEEGIELKEENKMEDDSPKTPDWQTDELPKNVLEEVKANIVEKSKLLKPLSLRKNIKLEKVGKVIKLDDLLRKKRHIISNKYIEKDRYETYIEKTT